MLGASTIERNYLRRQGVRALSGYCSGESYGADIYRTESDCVSANHEWVPQPPGLLPLYRALARRIRILPELYRVKNAYFILNLYGRC
jgi:hypothetical protein